MGIPFAWSAEVSLGLAALLDAGGPGVAVFDADGTLWAADVVEEFLGLCSERLPARHTPVWAANLDRVLNEITAESAALQLALFAGLDLTQAGRLAVETFEKRVAATAYEPVWELVRRLGSAGFEVWVCSGSPHWLVEPCVAALGVPADRVIGTRARLDGAILSADPVEITAGAGKRTAIERMIGDRLHFAAGDSMSDFEMLLLARNALVLAPADDDGRRGGLAERGRELGWWVQPVSGRLAREASA